MKSDSISKNTELPFYISVSPNGDFIRGTVYHDITNDMMVRYRKEMVKKSKELGKYNHLTGLIYDSLNKISLDWFEISKIDAL